MELLFGVVFVWCYIVVGFVVLALAACAIEPFDTGDISDSGIATLLFWPIVIVRTIVRRRWRSRHHERRKKQARDSQ